MFSPAARIVVFVGLAAALVFYGYDYSTRFDKQLVQSAAVRNEQAAALERQILDKLKTEDVVVGEGAEAKPGDRVAVDYIGTFTDGGKEFDNSYNKGAPLEFTLGAQQVIPGWDLGVRGMKVGGKRKLVIPPELAYGAQGSVGGEIPPNSTIYFTVELVSVTPPAQ